MFLKKIVENTYILVKLSAITLDFSRAYLLCKFLTQL